ncbi:MAG: hypothetical protein A3A72_06500, partial [Deltaproteobacteria bacterium RIFCSPLOWO2_01_FULL_38_9]
VEKLVTIPVERALKEVDGIEKLHSSSIEGRSVVIATLFEDLPQKEKDQVKTDIQRAIDRIDDLPADAEKPQVQDIRTRHISTIEINLSGLPEIELRKYAESLEDRLEIIPGVSSISKRGWRDREFWVEVNPTLLKNLHLSLSQIVGSLEAQNINLPGGSMKFDSQEFMVRTLGEIETPDQISNVIIRSNDLGNANKIQEVASVKDTFAEENRIEKLRGERAITLVVLKQEKGDIISIVNTIKQEVERFKKTIPPELKIETANDGSYYVKRRLNVLTSNGLFGMVLVLAVIFLFLSRRIAMITVLGIPFAFFTTLIAMKFFGLTINLVSMFGLIIVSGMVVDDAIVFAENIYSHMQRGHSPHEAALQGSHEVYKAVIGSVTTTMIAFLPLAFMAGFMGKFIWQIPAVVIIALAASLFEAMIILPGHCAEWINPQKERLISPTWFLWLKEKYTFLLEKTLTYKYRILGGTVLTLIVCIILGTQVIRFILFPARGIELFFIKAKTAIGTPIEETDKRMKVLEDLVATTLSSQELDTFTTQVGIIQKDVHDPFMNRGSHVAQITVFLTPESKRKRTADQIVSDLQKKGEGVQGFDQVRFMKVTPGPPIGKPVSIEIRGDDIETLKHIANLYKDELRKEKGVSEVEDSFESGKKEFQIVVDELKASQAGLSVGKIAQTIRTAFEGTIATTIKKANEEIYIRVRLAESYRNQPDIFKDIFVSNERGNLIPLQEVAKITEGQGISYINHYDYKRTISVTAMVDQKLATSLKINKKLQYQFKDLSEKFVGYSAKYGGEQEDSQKSLASLKRAFLLAFLAIFFLLCVIFKSLLQPFIILMTVPLSLIGVVIAFFFHREPFSFMALIGVIGLSGVVVNNAIILIDFINTHKKREENNNNLTQTIINACAERLRPIILTASTTIFGLGPVAYGIGGSDPILAPTALAFSWGLFFSTLLTLFIIPCIYSAVNDATDIFKKKFMRKVL